MFKKEQAESTAQWIERITGEIIEREAAGEGHGLYKSANEAFAKSLQAAMSDTVKDKDQDAFDAIVQQSRRFYAEMNLDFNPATMKAVADKFGFEYNESE